MHNAAWFAVRITWLVQLKIVSAANFLRLIADQTLVSNQCGYWYGPYRMAHPILAAAKIDLFLIDLQLFNILSLILQVGQWLSPAIAFQAKGFGKCSLFMATR